MEMISEVFEVGHVDDTEHKFVVICVKVNNQWLLVRHKERTTWEMPGGHIEDGESVYEAALRELYEESGIKAKTVVPIGDYWVGNGNDSSYGRLFYASEDQSGKLPDFEMAEMKLFDEFPENCTYPDIYKVLIPHILQYENKNKDRL